MLCAAWVFEVTWLQVFRKWQARKSLGLWRKDTFFVITTTYSAWTPVLCHICLHLHSLERSCYCTRNHTHFLCSKLERSTKWKCRCSVTQNKRSSRIYPRNHKRTCLFFIVLDNLEIFVLGIVTCKRLKVTLLNLTTDACTLGNSCFFFQDSGQGGTKGQYVIWGGGHSSRGLHTGFLSVVNT